MKGMIMLVAGMAMGLALVSCKDKKPAIKKMLKKINIE